MLYINFIKILSRCIFQISVISILTAFNSNAQEIHIVSDTSQWIASESYTGPWHKPVSLADNRCYDPSNIASNCGSSYANPNSKIDSCATAQPIWGGNDPNNDCYWGQKTYYFKTTFTISDIDSIEKIKGWIAVDNFFDIYVNGQKAGDEGFGSLRWSIDYNLTDEEHDHVNILPHLQNGQNEIIVAAQNVHGGTCYNFALFSFCLKIDISGPSNNSEGDSESACVGSDNWTLSPNPSQDIATLRAHCMHEEIAEVVVFDFSGKEVFKTFESLDEYKINCNFLPSGIYLIKIRYVNQEITVKELVVTH